MDWEKLAGFSRGHASLLIVQEKVYASLGFGDRQGFHVVDLRKENLVVRDDPEAAFIYLRDLSSGESYELALN